MSVDPVFSTAAERAEFEAATAAYRAVSDWIDADPRRGLVGCTPSMVAEVAIAAYRKALTLRIREWSGDQLHGPL